MKTLALLVLLGCGAPVSEVSSRIGKTPPTRVIKDFIVSQQAARLGVDIDRIRGFTATGDFLHEAAIKQAGIATGAIYDSGIVWSFIAKNDLFQTYKEGKTTGAVMVKLVDSQKDFPIRRVLSEDTSPAKAVEETKKLARMDDAVFKHGELEDKFFLKSLTMEEFVAEFKALLNTNNDLFSSEEFTQMVDYLDNGKKLKINPEGLERMIHGVPAR